jgi:hypothetical protein
MTQVGFFFGSCQGRWSARQGRRLAVVVILPVRSAALLAIVAGRPGS